MHIAHTQDDRLHGLFKLTLSALCLFFSLILSSQFTRAHERIAECKIIYTPKNQVEFDGKCLLITDPDGSFYIFNLNDEPVLFGEVSSIKAMRKTKFSVDVTSLVLDEGGGGHMSRWGVAEQSTMNRGCWNGKDFTICAR